MNKIFILFTLFFLLAFSVNATTYYVDKDSIGGSCSDSNPGTITRPWCTIGKANQMLRAGDIAYIRAGTYTENYQGYNVCIHPENSGVEGAPITYKNYNGELVIIADVYHGARIWRDYIILDGLEFTGRDYNNPTMETWIVINGDHNIVRNCKGFHSGYIAGLRIEPGTGYNKILDSIWAYTGPQHDWWVPGQGETSENYPNGETIRLEGHHTLIEGNTAWWGGHNVLGTMPESEATYNVIRKNEFYNPIYRCIGWGRPNLNPQYMVFEDNIVRNCERGYWGPSPGFQINGPYSIMRRNRVYAIDGPAISLTGWTWTWQGESGYYLGAHTKIYNNVIYDYGRNTWRDGPYGGIRISRGSGSEIIDPSFYVGVGIKNNIIYGSSTPSIDWKFDSSEVSFDIEANHLNDNGDPKFVSASNADFHLQSDSPAIDAGTFLTKTRSSGSGTKIPIEDAGYFFDGYGIVDGDIIQLEGQTQTAQIVSVDYDNNIITVDRSFSWYSGQGVALAYSGSAPDIGAFEYEGSTPPPTILGDLNNDGKVDIKDLIIVASNFGKTQFDPVVDTDSNGVINVLDIIFVASRFT